jgi:hypothetical protein
MTQLPNDQDTFLNILEFLEIGISVIIWYLALVI